jgi:hypothetical protein
LVLKTLDDSDTHSSVKATTILWELFDSSLSLPWHLIREYFRSPDLLSQPYLRDLVKYTLYEDWSNALWILVTIAQENYSSHWWNKMTPLLRQKALNTTTPSPYQTCQSLLTWADAQGSEKQELVQNLRLILDQWREKGKDLAESPFDYALMDILDNNTSLPRRLRTAVKQSFSQGQEATRELLQAWVNMKWDDVSKAFHKVTAWDPDRWGILHLAIAVEDFQNWLNKLYQGPSPDTETKAFIQKMLRDHPPVELLLGTPPWLSKLLQTLQDIIQSVPIQKHKAEIQAWCPWVLQLMNLE